MRHFQTLTFTPAGLADVSLAVAGCRAGAIGVVNFELDAEPARWLAALDTAARACTGYAVKLPALAEGDADRLLPYAARGLAWLIVDADGCAAAAADLARLRAGGVRVMAEVLTPQWPQRAPDGAIDALLLKGN